MIKYSLATSWDNRLVAEIANLNQQYYPRSKIVEIFGSFPKSIVGSGRTPQGLPNISWQKAVEHIVCAHKAGLKFNYLLNAPDFKGKEKNQAWIKKVIKSIQDLAKIGVDSLTIAHPVLIQLVKKKFPHFKINVSLIAGVDTIDAAKKYENMGVEVLNLNSHSINRNFAMLKAIRAAVSCELELYANIPCLDRCRFRDEHYKFVGHASQIGQKQGELTFDPFLLRCSLTYLQYPIQFLKSPFIRPEDISKYKKLGIDIFKLSNRKDPTAHLINTAQAYLSGKYNGNLFDLIFRKGSKFRATTKPVYPEIEKTKIPIIIDNRKLTQLDFFKNTSQLKEKDLADFYQTATKKAVIIQSAEINKLIKKLKTCQRTLSL